ncbi:MAG TPA: hypothetical protein VH678_12995 [Xanthobacteraceae bacterium]|jgi:hypothetical protein
MQTESARMSSAAEARFRIDYPNSEPRVVKVVALDPASEQVVRQVARHHWQRADFFTSLRLEQPAASQPWSMHAWLRDIAGHTKALVEEIAATDLVVMVASAGDAAEVASVIGEACAARKVMTTALIIGSNRCSGDDLSRTLRSVRPYASMLVIANDDEYIEEMLAALRA